MGELATKVGYSESQSKLSVRIGAHKKYSNFSLEDWIKQQLPFESGTTLLDIGCGSGNLFPVYSEMIGAKGAIVGMDQSSELLHAAQKVPTETRKILLQWDLNTLLPFVDCTFDYIISTFAIYYADDVQRILREIYRLLRKGGAFFLIGPTQNNAKELYEFNCELFGFGQDKKIEIRTNRLEKEFLPVAKEIFAEVTKQIIPSKLVFPTTEEFAKYYEATLLYEESLEKAPSDKDIYKTAAALGITKISKEMCVVQGHKP